MTDVELLLLKFKILKMDRDALEKLVEDTRDRTGDPTLDLDYMDRMERQATILNMQERLSRSSSSGSGAKADSKKSAKFDMSSYYRALDADEAEAEEMAERDEIRVLAQKRLDTMSYRECAEYHKPEKSPLESYIAELNNRS